MKAVKVTWIDTVASVEGWEDREGLRDMPPAKVHSLGFVVKDTKEYLTLAMTADGDSVHHRLTIPKVCIKKVRVLR